MATIKKATDLKLLQDSTLFSRLNETQLIALLNKLRPISFRRNDIIFLKSDPGDSLYIIRSGRVKIGITNAEGKDLIINIYGQGEIFGEMSVFDGMVRSADASALTAVEALQLSRTSFEELLNGVPGLAASIIALLSRRLRYTTEQAELLGLFGAYKRVAAKLVQLAEPDESTNLPVVTLSQQELAAMVGLTREWLNKVLKAFADQGLVELNWGKIIILNSQALKDWI